MKHHLLTIVSFFCAMTLAAKIDPQRDLSAPLPKEEPAETVEYIRAVDVLTLKDWHEYTGPEELLDPQTYNRRRGNGDWWSFTPDPLIDGKASWQESTGYNSRMLVLHKSTMPKLTPPPIVETIWRYGPSKDKKPYAEAANLSHNELRDITALAEHASLTTLWLGHNNLHCFPAGLLMLKNLKKLCLDNNQLTSLLGINNLQNLETKLCLRNNKLTDISPLVHLKKLQCLDVRDNNITKIDGTVLPDSRYAETTQISELMVDDEVLLPMHWCEQHCYTSFSERDFLQPEFPRIILRLTSGKIYLYGIDDIDYWIKKHTVLAREAIRHPFIEEC